MDNGTTERKTRSGRKISGNILPTLIKSTATKRKRTEDTPEAAAKMPKTTEAAPAWFTQHLDAAMETNRTKIAADTAATVAKFSASLEAEIEKTNQNLAKHKHDVDEIMKRMQKNIDNCIQRDDKEIPAANSYAIAAAAPTRQIVAAMGKKMTLKKTSIFTNNIF